MNFEIHHNLQLERGPVLDKWFIFIQKKLQYKFYIFINYIIVKCTKIVSLIGRILSKLWKFT